MENGNNAQIWNQTRMCSELNFGSLSVVDSKWGPSSLDDSYMKVWSTRKTLQLYLLSQFFDVNSLQL